MPFNISAFKSNGLVYGGSRPSLFNVFLHVPQSLGIDQVSVDKFRFVCQAAELPAAIVQPIDIGYFGRKIKVAGDRTYGNWTVSVMNDEDFSVKSLFEAWSNGLNRFVSNVRDSELSEEEYKQDLEIFKYSKDGEITRAYTMVGAWPMEVGPITQNWNDQNKVEQFDVTFCYDYWVPLTEDSTKKAGGVNTYGTEAEEDGPNGPT